METTVTVPFKIKTPEEDMQRLNILLYGKPGEGKTWLAGTAMTDERMAPVLFLDVEGGSSTLHHRDERLQVVEVQAVKATRNAAKPGIADVYSFLLAGGHGFKTVVIDSLTELHKLTLYEIVDEQRGKPGRDPDLPTLQDWGKAGEKMRKIIRLFRDLPLHFVATALEQENKDELTGEITITPSMPGKLAPEIAGFFSIVGRLYTTKEVNEQGQRIRKLMVQPNGKVQAKDRFNALGLQVINPSLPSILDAITTH